MGERIARLVVIVLAGLLGAVMFAVPDRMAAALGLQGTDEFAYRSGGAAFLGYAIAFAVAWTDSASSLRILWMATLGAAVATGVAALIAMVSGPAAGIVVTLILGGAVVVDAVALYALSGIGAELPAPTGRRFATWFVYFLGWGVIASALFGLGGLVLGSTFGSVAGFPGGDDAAYRLAGGATVGILIGTLIILRTQEWNLVRRPALMAFVTNLLTLVGGILYISHGGVPVVAYLIAAAAVFNIAGLGLALAGRR